VTPGEKRYFRVLGAVSALSLATIGGIEAMERYVGPAWEVFPSLASQPAQAQARPVEPSNDESEPIPELSLDAPSLMPGEAISPCVAALDPLDLEGVDRSTRWVPPLSLDEDERCLRVD